MRIALRESGKTTWLGGEPGVDDRVFSRVAGLGIDSRILTQENNFIRADEAKVEDRKNLKTTVTWTTTRKFETTAAAEMWTVDYDRTMPRNGTLILQSEIPGGGEINRYLPNAVVHPPRRVVNGVSVTLTYQAEGGEIKKTNPDA
jgi:hypothetical protein